jgi:hypothetical protein
MAFSCGARSAFSLKKKGTRVALSAARLCYAAGSQSFSVASLIEAGSFN